MAGGGLGQIFNIYTKITHSPQKMRRTFLKREVSGWEMGDEHVHVSI